jgi:hypothetical protein
MIHGPCFVLSICLNPREHFLCDVAWRLCAGLATQGEEIMSQDEACVELARECPRKILGALHRQGQYVHGTSSRFPGKVLCFHRDSPLPEDWTPTLAQAAVSRCHCLESSELPPR